MVTKSDTATDVVDGTGGFGEYVSICESRMSVALKRVLQHCVSAFEQDEDCAQTQAEYANCTEPVSTYFKETDGPTSTS